MQSRTDRTKIQWVLPHLPMIAVLFVASLAGEPAAAQGPVPMSIERLPAPLPMAQDAWPSAGVEDVRQDPLWSDYQSSSALPTISTGDCGCGTCDCGPAKKKPLKQIFGKVSKGFDVLIFGSSKTKSGCDTSCDACCDTACDAIGISQSHSHAPVGVPQPGVSIPNENRPNQIQSLPEMPREVPTRTRPSNPFLDDPITATGRMRIKPTSFRRR